MKCAFSVPFVRPADEMSSDRYATVVVPVTPLTFMEPKSCTLVGPYSFLLYPSPAVAFSMDTCKCTLYGDCFCQYFILKPHIVSQCPKEGQQSNISTI